MLLQYPAGFVLTGDMDFDVFRVMLLAAIAAINECFLRSDAGQTFGLLERVLKRRAIVGVAVLRRDRDHPVALGGRHDGHLAAEFIFLVRFAFGDAFDLRRVHAVELGRVILLLRVYARSVREQFFEARCRSRVFTLDIPQHAAEIVAQLLGLFLGPLELARPGVAALVVERLLADPLVALAQLDAGLLRFPHHRRAGLLVKPGVGRKGDGFLLYRGVNVDALKIFRRERLTA